MSAAPDPSLIARRRLEDRRVASELGLDENEPDGSAEDTTTDDAIDAPGPDFNSWFREATSNGSDSDALKESLHDWLMEAHAGYWSLKKAAIYRTAIDQWLTRKLRELRTAMREEAERSDDARLRQAEKGTLSASVGERLTSLWMFPLHGGMPLRDATYDDLAQSIKKYRHDIGVYARRADFLEAVQKKLPDRGTTVGRALSDTDLDALARTTGMR